MNTITYIRGDDGSWCRTESDGPPPTDLEVAAMAVPAAPGEVVVAWGDQTGVLGADTLTNLGDRKE